MKKIAIYLFTPVLMAAAAAGCEAELDRLWENPNKYTPSSEEVCSGLFTHMQKTRFWQKDYGEWYYLFSSQQFPFFIQLNAVNPSVLAGDDKQWTTPDWTSINNFFTNYGQESYVASPNGGVPEARFERFYTDLTNYGLIRDEVEIMKALGGSEYSDNLIYFKLATILKDVVALHIVDLFNHIPYTNAFKGSQGVFFASYDDPVAIYSEVLAELQSIAAELPAVEAAMSPAAKKVFARQDIFFRGDVGKWVQYINGETLRACIRISGVSNSMNIDVNGVIAQVKDNLLQEDFTFPFRMDNDYSPGSNSDAAGGELYNRAIDEIYSYMAIPNTILKRMNRGSMYWEPDVDDPRLPVIAMGYTPTASADDVRFHGISMNYNRNIDSIRLVKLRNISPQTGGDSAKMITRAASSQTGQTWSLDQLVQSCPWTLYNPVTYIFARYPFNIQTRAEVDLLLAEAALNNLGGVTNAGEHIYNAVIHSVDFWYMINGSPLNNENGLSYSDFAKAILQPEKPDAAAYAATIRDEFEAAPEKMEILMQQKYIHLNVMSPFELFAELRRTGYPKLEPVSWSDGNNVNISNGKQMVERFRYPESERSTNREAWSKWAQEDNWITPVFWAPKRAQSDYYRNDVLP
ncbi:MAG: SusD/RagB family nutrient-binding outer membrane lipoprotein [Prevotellaceae bacterium]|jgi:hypothetical protein|nr:SusD/RagB family nutrient-binding outer membrane lipoprotein [Prevotellaceae bacterium]